VQEHFVFQPQHLESTGRTPCAGIISGKLFRAWLLWPVGKNFRFPIILIRRAESPLLAVL
jgi:hypothetical protein